ncbi:hypothetical protein, conserved [Eimeria necatrix]|uniref:Uncharacterized protein n=1 Tax=Eimeria necatrix TaxID=51315 RepID=U6N603_9EIME|nr:hypothetical protein, conserved [Eimeria necatrix]CDJ69345.1 hypothetical protein, conserved [Eimeria necatrix]
MPEEEGPSCFWWLTVDKPESGEALLRTTGHWQHGQGQSQQPQESQKQQWHRRSLHLRLHGKPVGQAAVQSSHRGEQRQWQKEQRHRKSLHFKVHRGSLNPANGEQLLQQQKQKKETQRHRQSVHFQLHSSSSESDDSDTEGPLEEQQMQRQRKPVRLQLRVDPQDSDTDIPVEAEQQQQQQPGDTPEFSDSEESDWSDGETSREQGPSAAEDEAPAPVNGPVDLRNLEGSSLPASVVNKAITKINKRYEKCGETARKMTRSEEELISSVVSRWEQAGFPPFKIEGMTVNPEEQGIMLHNEALTPNLVNVFLKALEINKTPLTTPKYMCCLIAHAHEQISDFERRRPKQTSLTVELASKLLSPVLSPEDNEAILEALETRGVLEAQVTVLPLLSGSTHYSALILDTITGPNAVLFLLRWFDPFGEPGKIPVQHLLPLLKRLAEKHGLRVYSLYRTNFDSEPSIAAQYDERDTGVLCCMIATQLAEGCSPMAEEGDALYFRKQMLLKLDFASRWKRAASTERGGSKN